MGIDEKQKGNAQAQSFCLIPLSVCGDTIAASVFKSFLR